MYAGTIVKIVTGLIMVSSLPVLGQEQEYKAGFKIISIYDSSRAYKPNSLTSDKLHYRPIEIDLWYPAEITSSDTTASFVNFVYLLEQRSNFYDDTKNYRGISDELLQYICAGFNCEDYSTLKKVKTESYLNAKSIEEKFPLIIYLAGLNGMSYENYLLFEGLAKKGFIVVSVSSIGRYPGNMTMDTADLFEQINDARFIIHYLTKSNLVSENIGLVGYSWGGLAASILSMIDPINIKVVVSLDGSEQFGYGDEEEKKTLRLLRASGFFKPGAIKSSYLYLDSDISEWRNLSDSIYNIIDFISSDKYYLKINNSTHEDFSSISVISNKDQVHNKYHLIQQLTINYLLEKIKGRNVFLKNIPHGEVTKIFSQPILKNVSKENERILKGSIKDKKSNSALQYVNIGILNKDKGTTTDAKGKFELKISESNIKDTLRISMVGYEPRIVYLKDLLTKKEPHLNIYLQEQINDLQEIVVMEEKLVTKILGNKTDSKFFGAKFASDDLGSEIAIRIKIKEAPTYLDAFNFNISYNSSDTATFRVNIYQIKNGLPDKNILRENIIIRTGNQTGKIELDLSKYNIVVNDDFFISLEWIQGNKNSGIVFSAGFINKGTYYRKASQGRWKKYPIGVGFNVTIKY